MSGPRPLNPEQLLHLRSAATLVGFGRVVYTIEGSRWQASDRRLRPPRYRWVFEPGKELDPNHHEGFSLEEPLVSALATVRTQGGTLHVEGWGLLRQVEGGVELLADSGALADDHPHYGWLPIQARMQSLPQQNPVHRKGVGPKSPSRYRRMAWAYTIAWVLVVGLVRLGLTADGADPGYGKPLSLAGYPGQVFVGVPFTRSTDPFDPCLRQGNLESPLDLAGSGTLPSSWPVHRVVVGLYSQKALAESKLNELKDLGYTARLTPRWVRGRWLTAVCLEYRGLYLMNFLESVREQVIKEAWIWPETV
ncbi:MAG: hypothetical protein ACO31H_04430 [Bacteroidia bacterium]